MIRAYRFVAPLVAALVLVACSGGSSPSAAEGTTVNVTLQEFSVLPESDSAPAGSITFAVTNNGPDDVHEFVIVKTDLDPGDLPTDEDGAVDEEGEGIEPVDEIEDIEVDSTQELTVNLEAGSYVLICNIVETEDDGTVESHYAMGMRAAFTVE